MLRHSRQYLPRKLGPWSWHNEIIVPTSMQSKPARHSRLLHILFFPSPKWLYNRSAQYLLKSNWLACFSAVVNRLKQGNIAATYFQHQRPSSGHQISCPYICVSDAYCTWKHLLPLRRNWWIVTDRICCAWRSSGNPMLMESLWAVAWEWIILFTRERTKYPGFTTVDNHECIVIVNFVVKSTITSLAVPL